MIAFITIICLFVVCFSCAIFAIIRQCRSEYYYNGVNSIEENSSKLLSINSSSSVNE
jgi:hypothetical protein